MIVSMHTLIHYLEDYYSRSFFFYAHGYMLIILFIITLTSFMWLCSISDIHCRISLPDIKVTHSCKV